MTNVTRDESRAFIDILELSCPTNAVTLPRREEWGSGNLKVGQAASNTMNVSEALEAGPKRRHLVGPP